MRSCPDSVRVPWPGLLAMALVAAGLVVAFMFATYGTFGFIANIALIVHVGLILGLMSVLEATMTLPGIAGMWRGPSQVFKQQALQNRAAQQSRPNGLTCDCPPPPRRLLLIAEGPCSIQENHSGTFITQGRTGR